MCRSIPAAGLLILVAASLLTGQQPAPVAYPDEKTSLDAPSLDDLLAQQARPFDVLRLKDGSTVKIIPLAEHPGQPANFTGSWVSSLIDKPAEVVKYAKTDVRSVEYFETTALSDVARLLDGAKPFKSIPERDRLDAAEKLLRSLLAFHFGARRHAPLGENPWTALHAAIESKLLKVRSLRQGDPLKIAKEHLAAGDFSGLRQEIHRIDQEAIYAGPDLVPLQMALRAKAEELFREGKEGAVAAKLEESLLLWPWLPGARDELARQRNTYKTLLVAVPELPEYLSLGTAWTDPEKQAVELLFESLMQVRHEAKVGQTYKPVLAGSVPKVEGLGRRFVLTHDARWSDGERLTSLDIRHTTQLGMAPLGAPPLEGQPTIWRDLVELPRSEDSPFELVFKFRQGLFDPLAPFTFKILPQKFRGKPLTKADDPDFAKSPVGSGPFVYAGRKVEEGRTYCVFLANPAYVRKGNAWPSQIREIRMFAWADAAKDLAQPSPHLVLGIPSEQLNGVHKMGTYVIRNEPTRRVHALAMNHRRPSLANQNLRRALAHALQRDLILDSAFRDAGDKAKEKHHKPVNGPFPAGSWALAPASQVPDDLYQPELSRSTAKKAFAELGAVRLTLKYPSNDAGIRRACQAIADQWSKIFADSAAKIEIVPVPVTAREMRESLVNHDFDLAYHPLDFADDNYWLWPLFDPHPDALAAGGSNYLGYDGDAKMQSLLRAAMATRQFSTLRDLYHNIHAHMIERMPLIPLWQLDTPIAAHPTLDPVGLDPLLVFPNVLHWKWKQ